MNFEVAIERKRTVIERMSMLKDVDYLRMHKDESVRSSKTSVRSNEYRSFTKIISGPGKKSKCKVFFYKLTSIPRNAE